MIEVEYDHADRSPHHDQARDGRVCVVCDGKNRLREYGFEMFQYGQLSFTYHLICPDCGDKSTHTDTIRNLTFTFRIEK